MKIFILRHNDRLRDVFEIFLLSLPHHNRSPSPDTLVRSCSEYLILPRETPVTYIFHIVSQLLKITHFIGPYNL